MKKIALWLLVIAVSAGGIATATGGAVDEIRINGKIDIIAGPVTKNPDRDPLVDSSRTYFATTMRRALEFQYSDRYDCSR